MRPSAPANFFPKSFEKQGVDPVKEPQCVGLTMLQNLAAL
jgi:hypothetical protein